MRVLKIIHGFPPDYMAGSEVYSYHLVKELRSQNIEVFVFTRSENQFDKEYTIYDELFENISIKRVNKSKRDYRYEQKFYDERLELIFEDYLKELAPDIVHIGHLCHLSTNLIKIIKSYNIPIVFTIHDFWMHCVKGQLVNKRGEICEGPGHSKCKDCSPFSVTMDEVKQSAKHIGESLELIDRFISPSHTLRDFFISQGVSGEKISYLKYGFNTGKIEFNPKTFSKDNKINFGFMGRVIPTKGIKVLIDAFRELPEVKLSIYGGIGAEKRFLESDNVIFKGRYDNNNINEVLSEIDVLIVPSTWYENAPLVIQEAFLAGIPVITSNIGGMKELVRNNVNGFTFEVNDSDSLKEVIERVVANPELLNHLERSRDMVVDIRDDVNEIIKIYRGLQG